MPTIRLNTNLCGVSNLPPVDFTHLAMALQLYARLAGELLSMLRWEAYHQTYSSAKVFRTSLDASFQNQVLMP